MGKGQKICRYSFFHFADENRIARDIGLLNCRGTFFGAKLGSGDAAEDEECDDFCSVTEPITCDKNVTDVTNSEEEEFIIEEIFD